MGNTPSFSIGTIGSHSALQIFKGAKQEGFRTVCICTKKRHPLYESFKVVDEYKFIEEPEDLFALQDELIKQNTILIPHGSFLAYYDIEKIKGLKVKYFGNKAILSWECDRQKQREWLKNAGIHLPRIFDNPSDIDCTVIVKFHGAKGGQDYFLANSYSDYKGKIKAHNGKKHIIQEYIMGVPIYVHYFYSPLTDELEIMSMDKRYESNVDSLGRISARDQMALQKVDPSYVVVGNIPIVLRESLLPITFKMGMKVIEESKKIVEGGLWGPFCLEGIITPKQEFIIFEISARIVAGTNPFIMGSPYTDLRYDEPMSTGRRIAREIKIAIATNQLHKIIQ